VGSAIVDLGIVGFRGLRAGIGVSFVLVFVCADGEEGVRKHGEGHVPLPGVIETHLVVEADAAFAGFETFFDRPADAGDAEEFAEASRCGLWVG
jgi:hypothetical protein